MKTFNQQYSTDFTNKCRNALEDNFGEIPMPNCLGGRKESVTDEPVYIVEVIHKTKLVNKRRFNKNKKKKNGNIVIKIGTRIKIGKI